MILINYPTRLNVGILLFLAAVTTFVLRVNLSINILGMVEPTPTENHSMHIEPPDYGPRYNWTQAEQSLLLGSYFWGYILTQLPAGLLCDIYGGRAVIGYTLGLSGIATALIPSSAEYFSIWAVFAVRALTGGFAGFLFPAMQNIISKWAPPDEKGKFMLTLMGGTMGTVITWPVAGWLMQSFGWVYAFYVPAIFSLLVSFLWFFIVYNTPAEHPRITPKENIYIENSIGGNTPEKKKGLPPIMCMMKSLPFWALVFLHYGNTWALCFLVIEAPKYMNEILNFNLSNAGIWAAVPYLSRFFAGFLFGALVDILTKQKVFRMTTIRKFFCLFSHIIPGIMLYSLSYVGNRPYICVGIVTFAMTFNGATTVTNLSNAQDLAPNYTAFTFSVINFIGTTPGFLSPMVVTYFTSEKNTIDEWNIIFLVSAVFYILPGILFIIFGSGEIQYWNDVSQKSKEKSKEKEQRTDESRF